MTNKTKKSILTLVFILTLALIPTMAHGAAEDFEVTIFGEEVEFAEDMGYPYLSSQNRTMIPIRIVSEIMGYDVAWVQDTKTAIVKNNEDTLEITIDKNKAKINGEEIYIDIQSGKPADTKAVLRDSRTYVPVRFVSEAMGADVGYTRREVIATGHITHVITIKAKDIVTMPIVTGEVNFDPGRDIMPDGRMTQKKTEEFIEEMIEGTTLKKENGKVTFSFVRPNVPSDFRTVVGLQTITHTGDGQYALTSANAFLPKNQLPINQSFSVDLDANNIANTRSYKFTFVVANSSGDYSASYTVTYEKESKRLTILHVDKDGNRNFDTIEGINKSYDELFDLSRIFEGIDYK